MNQVSFVLVTILAGFALAENNEEEARIFIDKVIEELKVKLDDLNVKEWAMIVADQDFKRVEATKEYEEVDKKTSEYQNEMYSKFIKFKWHTFKNPSLKRKFFATMVVLKIKAMPRDKRMELLDLRRGVNNLKMDPKVKDMSSKDMLSQNDIEDKLNQEKDRLKLNYYWNEVHEKVSTKAKKPFTRIVELENEAAVANDYKDFSKLYQAAYEVDNFEPTMLKLYEDIKPLFQELHAYVRFKLWEAYGKDNTIIDPEGPIPASLLGWTWGADASPVFDLVAPFPGKPLVDITGKIQDSKIQVSDMAKKAENFYTSLGLSPFTDDFRKNSILEKKDGVDCSSRVSFFTTKEDYVCRLRLCAEPTQSGHILLHSWFGYIQLGMAIKDLPRIFKTFPNYAFDNAFQNVMEKFSMAPNYLKIFGLLDTNFQSDEEMAIKTLLSEALENMFSLPFALAWDQWRWRVAEGNISPEQYNCKYWDIRTKLQGVEPPVDRDENDFDPGDRLRYIAGGEHIMYFIAEFLKLDMMRALCKSAGYYDPQTKQKNPLVFCDVYGKTTVGDKLKEMLALGASEPWYVALEKITGKRELDSSALLEYYEPLLEWLRDQNQRNGAKLDWKTRSMPLKVRYGPGEEGAIKHNRLMITGSRK